MFMPVPHLLPELDAFLSTFKVRFRRPEAQAALERYLTGLLTELPNKNCDTMAQAVPGTHEQRLQGFLTTMNVGRRGTQSPAREQDDRRGHDWPWGADL